jgi:methyltransferase (TIGR00027 family)
VTSPAIELPNLSYLLAVGRLRFIQSVHEPAERRNPDTLVRRFFPMRERWRVRWLGRKELARLRSQPMYYYLIARTRYYDGVFGDALAAGTKRILNVGCGSDTRAYRFAADARANGVAVWECDQEEAIRTKAALVKRLGEFDHVQYLAIDLNDGDWPELARRLDEEPGRSTLVLMEGVSPYIDEAAFRRFLALLSAKLPAGSRIAYDFKFRGADDAFGRTGRTGVPFRLPPAADGIAAFHDALGLRLEHFESSLDLRRRLVPGLDESATAAFREDGLVRLRIGGA